MSLIPFPVNVVQKAGTYTLQTYGNSNTFANALSSQYEISPYSIFTATGSNIGIGTIAPEHTLHVEGKIFASGSISAYSDQRLKTDIVTISNALDLVKKLRGVKYMRTDTLEKQIGLIAQEVDLVLPEIVTTTPSGLSLSYGNLVAVLIEAIKDMSVRIETLENAQVQSQKS